MSFSINQFPLNTWLPMFESANSKGLFENIIAKLKEDFAQSKVVFPPIDQIYRAFDLCDFKDIKVVILGQDPYHGDGEANGLCFSVNNGVKIPPSLRNILKEIKNSYPEFDTSRSTDLSDWASQGVLLINSVLTVEKDKAASHSKYGWQRFTDFIISEISSQKDFVIFILLGNFAKTKIPLIDLTKHSIITSVHPSPLSAHNGFFGSEVFLKTNETLNSMGLKTIEW